MPTSSGADLNPALEAYFVRMAMELGTNPTPLYGIDRDIVARAVKQWLFAQFAVPAQRNMLMELWGLIVPRAARVEDCPHDRSIYEADYVLSMSDHYLDWLYAHAR